MLLNSKLNLYFYLGGIKLNVPAAPGRGRIKLCVTVILVIPYSRVIPGMREKSLVLEVMTE